MTRIRALSGQDVDGLDVDQPYAVGPACPQSGSHLWHLPHHQRIWHRSRPVPDRRDVTLTRTGPARCDIAPVSLARLGEREGLLA